MALRSSTRRYLGKTYIRLCVLCQTAENGLHRRPMRGSGAFRMDATLAILLVKFRDVFVYLPIEVRSRVLELIRAGEYEKANLVLDGWGK